MVFITETSSTPSDGLSVPIICVIVSASVSVLVAIVIIIRRRQQRRYGLNANYAGHPYYNASPRQVESQYAGRPIAHPHHLGRTHKGQIYTAIQLDEQNQNNATRAPDMTSSNVVTSYYGADSGGSGGSGAHDGGHGGGHSSSGGGGGGTSSS